MRPKFLLPLSLLLVTGLALVGIRALGRSDTSQSARKHDEQAPPVQAPPPVGSASAPVRTPDPAKGDNVVRYQQLLSRLQEARDARLAKVPDGGVLETAAGGEAPASANAPAIPRPLGSLDKEYIQTQMQEITPLFAECYEMALEAEPALEGRVVIETKLIGEEDIGGLLESSEVLVDQSDIVSPHFLECVRETMYALQLEAPESGGEVVIRYPLLFHPGDEEDEGDEE